MNAQKPWQNPFQNIHWKRDIWVGVMLLAIAIVGAISGCAAVQGYHRHGQIRGQVVSHRSDGSTTKVVEAETDIPLAPRDAPAFVDASARAAEAYARAHATVAATDMCYNGWEDLRDFCRTENLSTEDWRWCVEKLQIGPLCGPATRQGVSFVNPLLTAAAYSGNFSSLGGPRAVTAEPRGTSPPVEDDDEEGGGE